MAVKRRILDNNYIRMDLKELTMVEVVEGELLTRTIPFGDARKLLCRCILSNNQYRDMMYLARILFKKNFIKANPGSVYRGMMKDLKVKKRAMLIIRLTQLGVYKDWAELPQHDSDIDTVVTPTTKVW